MHRVNTKAQRSRIDLSSRERKRDTCESAEGLYSGRSRYRSAKTGAENQAAVGGLHALADSVEEVAFQADRTFES